VVSVEYTQIFLTAGRREGCALVDGLSRRHDDHCWSRTSTQPGRRRDRAYKRPHTDTHIHDASKQTNSWSHPCNAIIKLLFRKNIAKVAILSQTAIDTLAKWPRIKCEMT